MSTLIVTGALVILHMRMVVILMRVMIKDVGIPVNDDKMSTLIVTGALVISHMTMVMILKMAIVNDYDDKI